MPFRIVLPDPVRDLIRAVVPPIEAEVLLMLQRLGDRPRLGAPIRGGDFDGLMAFRFRVFRAPGTAEFAVLYRFHPNEEEIVILDFCRLKGDPPRREPPRF